MDGKTGRHPTSFPEIAFTPVEQVSLYDWCRSGRLRNLSAFVARRRCQDCVLIVPRLELPFGRRQVSLQFREFPQLVLEQGGVGKLLVETRLEGRKAPLVRFEIGLHEVRITPTIGAVLVPQDGANFSLLMRKADSAMYAGKDRGRNCLVFFDSSLDNDAQRRVRMTSLLRIDTDRNGFRFVAQPKVDASGKPVGAELLMRWTTEAFGSVSPVEFIPLAEKVGLIGMIGRHAMHAAAQLASESARVGHALPVAVNLSPKQLLQPGLDGLLLGGDHQPLVQYESLGRDAQLAIPSADHYLPLLYVLGTQQTADAVTFPVEGIEGGSISMLSVEVGG